MLIEPAEIFKVLGVETRVRIIELLKAHGALGVKEIAERLGITPPAVSQHLKLLKQAGLVRSERHGYWIPYSINEEAMEGCREILNQVCSCGCRGTGKFRAKELAAADLSALRKYEHELRKELATVQNRINEVNTAE